MKNQSSSNRFKICKPSRFFLFAAVLGMIGTSSAHAAEDLAAQIQEIRTQVNELRAQQSLNIFNFSGDLTTRFDDLSVSNKTDTSLSTTQIGTTTGLIAVGSSPFNSTIKTGSVTVANTNLAGAFASAYGALGPNPAYNEINNYYRLKSNLNVGSSISNTVKFYSRLTVSKFFNIYQQQGTSTGVSSSISTPNNYLSDQIWLTRAYADWAMTPSIIFSIGRLPTTDGPPANFPDGRSRMGTYPSVSYNNFIDGLALTYKGDSWMPQDQKIAFRFAYTPVSNLNLGGAATGQGYYRAPWIGSGQGGLGAQSSTSMDAYAAQIDYDSGNTSWTENTNIILQYFQTGPFRTNNTAPTSGTNNGDPTDLGLSINMATAEVEFDGLFHTGLDLSVSYNYSNVYTSGTEYLPMLVSGTSSSIPLNTYAYVPYGGFGCAPNMSTGGLGCTTTYSGGETLISARYKVLAKAYAGAEFVTADPSNFYFAAGDDTLSGFYGTKGQGYHLYWTQMFTPTMSLRLGGMYQNVTNQSMGFGQAANSITQYLTTSYANYRLDF
jgi:hypothetical protein